MSARLRFMVDGMIDLGAALGGRVDAIGACAATAPRTHTSYSLSSAFGWSTNAESCVCGFARWKACDELTAAR